MRTHLTFDEAVMALEQSSFTICMHPMNGEPLVVTFIGWDDEDEGANVDFIIEPEGCDNIYMNKNDTFEITSDGRGFKVPGHSLWVFPNKPFNFKET
jgi:hypothetical protein